MVLGRAMNQPSLSLNEIRPLFKHHAGALHPDSIGRPRPEGQRPSGAARPRMHSGPERGRAERVSSETYPPQEFQGARILPIAEPRSPHERVRPLARAGITPLTYKWAAGAPPAREITSVCRTSSFAARSAAAVPWPCVKHVVGDAAPP
jgi:hypothetical protein